MIRLLISGSGDKVLIITNDGGGVCRILDLYRQSLTLNRNSAQIVGVTSERLSFFLTGFVKTFYKMEGRDQGAPVSGADEGYASRMK
jgi:hypothetical protein